MEALGEGLTKLNLKISCMDIWSYNKKYIDNMKELGENNGANCLSVDGMGVGRQEL